MATTETPKEAAGRLAQGAKRDGYKPQALHAYTDAEGNPIYWRIRMRNPSTGEKWIRPMHLNGHGYELKEPEFTDGKPIYNLRGIATRPADPVFIVEGEWCADKLAKIGALATTSGAADSAGKADWQPLAGRSVTIWPDNDEAGMRYADEVDAQLLPLGCTVRRVDVDALNLPRKGDAVDWLEAHPTATVADVAALPSCGAETAGAAVAEAWPEPKPLVADLRPEPYPVDALPDAIRAAVLEVQRFVQAPIALVAASALSAVSCAGQGLVDVARSSTLRGPASLYMLTIAESGERKSTCDHYFSKAIREFEAHQEELARTEVARCLERIAAWKSEKAGVHSAISAAKKRGRDTTDLKRQLDDLTRAEPQPYRYPQMLRDDATQEALAAALSKEWPSASVISAEGASFLGAHAMGRDSIVRYLGLVNKLWSGEEHRVKRRTSESFVVAGARLTLGLQVQPAALADFVETNGDLARGIGFFARFLLACPETTMGLRSYKDEPTDWTALDRFDARIGEILGLVRVDEAGVLQLSTLALTSSAFAAWREFHDEVEVELAAGGDLEFVRDVAAKAADNVARLAALFHVFEFGPHGEIASDTIERARRGVAWYLSESRRFFGAKFLSPEQRNAAALDAWLIARCRGQRTERISTRDVSQFGPRSVRDADARDQALEMLMELGRARLVVDGKKRDIAVNPALLRDEGDA